MDKMDTIDKKIGKAIYLKREEEVEREAELEEVTERVSSQEEVDMHLSYQ